ncbi:hypothetical protein FQA47_001349 [Oryzias melastigma]|uniref:Transcription initiation factor SL1/TIF-IB subunit D n=1 Tax=Oryzias melastigma TaxID=30732 RepID=A0A834FRH5_ORYME|nr:hypothetical protein FQA47_001349 [Oryzias melastigma]
MSQAGNGLTQSESDVLAGVISGQSCHVVFVESPPDYVRKISKYLESSGKREGRCEAPNEASSDSGDSLFITQKPVPEAVRPKRRRSTHPTHFIHRGDLTDQDDASSSSSDWESRTGKKKKVVYRLPKFIFPFLQEGKSSQKKHVSTHRNKKLHTFAIGGFFKCVQEEEECGRNRNLTASLPTIDREGEYIAAISEPEEEERTEAEDIQVVERKRFVVSLKAKSIQPWYEPRETCSEDKRQTEGAQNSGSESQSQRQRMGEAAAVGRRLFSRAKSCDEGDSSHGGMKDRLAGDTSRIQTERADKSPKRKHKKLKLLPNVNANQLCDDSDATVCDTDADKRFGTNTEAFTKAADCEHEGPDLQHDTADDSVCESTKKKKKKKRKKYKGDLSLEEAEGKTAEEFVKITEEENSCLPQDTSESADLNQNTLSITYADHQIGPEVNVEKRKKKKRKQVEQLQTAAEPQTENEEPEKCLEGVSDQTAAGPSDDLLGSSENIEAPLETSVKKKKHKKKKRLSVFNDTQVDDSCIDVDVSNDLSLAKSMGTSVQKNINDSCSPETQTMTEQVVTKKKKKRREKLSDDTNAQCESARKKDEKRASSFHQQEQAGPDSEEKPAGRTSDATAQSAGITASSEERDTGRKKKKRSAAQLSEDRDSEELRETCQSSPSVVIKKKRKLTESSESAEPAQTPQFEMPWKKKKKKNKEVPAFQHLKTHQ